MISSWINITPGLIFSAWLWSAVAGASRRPAALNLIDRCGRVLGVGWLAAIFGGDILHGVICL